MAQRAATTGAPSDDATRGRPYYEKLRKDLKQTLVKKRELDNRVVRITSASSCSLHFLGTCWATPAFLGRVLLQDKG